VSAGARVWGGGLPPRRPTPALPPISQVFTGPFLLFICRFAARPDCGSKYQLCVQLLSSAHAPLGTFQPDPVMIQQKSDAKWREVCGQGPHGNLGLTCFSRRIGVSFQLRQQSRETERAPTQKQFPERMPPWCTDCLASIHRALCSIPSAKK
jgi:hypothetical protein